MPVRLGRRPPEVFTQSSKIRDNSRPRYCAQWQPPPATSRKPHPMTATRRVLLVEDDAHIADLLTLHLRDEGLEVMHCARGDDGLRQLERGGWDALVLDIMLPGVDG